MPKTNDLWLALDYLCKWLVILSNVYLPLIGLLLLLFCGQDPCPLPFQSSWCSLDIGRVIHFIAPWAPFPLLSDRLGYCLGTSAMVGEGWVFVSFSALNTLNVYSGLSHCCSIDGEKSSAVQISEVKTGLKNRRAGWTLFLQEYYWKGKVPLLLSLPSPSCHDNTYLHIPPPACTGFQGRNTCAQIIGPPFITAV